MTAETDIHYMQLAIIEAKKGLGRTSPNPPVGAIIVRDNIILGTGYHRKAGEPHAEVNAIADAKGDTAGATIYVTLEPCNHTGRTPPCTLAILKAGITRVVIGLPDPNPGVQGGGELFLKDQGIDVITGILQYECRKLVYPFLKHSTTKIPWVILKAGMSLDSRITYTKGKGGGITGSESHHFVHQLRDQTDAILVGINTALIDNPSLTTRLPDAKGKDPLRVILDSQLRLPPQAKMLHQGSSAKTIIFHSHDAPQKKADHLLDVGCKLVPIETIPSSGCLNLHDVLSWLGQHDITSVLVEGGSHIHGNFLSMGMVDEFCLLYAPFFIGDQGQSVITEFSLPITETKDHFVTTEVRQLGNDVLIRGIRKEYLNETK
ncbi:bifunctional diaminohydroxyphosphoribosylaminopyrimidine deaminase/5-amino-6-(5-phosphoribosylamino)uracil reductase RibD [Desulfogranum japonicum]|uniref:bifunctional diaminohydroxyphosphoribosylaminopyrimidine deaminase/5-amino-6-(5-phosphoribosylamino)uracil reductase RibD n=1 Tax=Desulfogranum japonicum TaxID=231447 RepID=UPI000408F872|nr:bifunctional diaminohydroxyphosphoribosylaminopyrimidine deaminase/5-amino-6-(5-phosphoribosylamino)uracil reductase RibD [Desulfogranum japonicum]